MGNWWFTATGALVFIPVAWWVTVRVVEPRLGPWTPAEGTIAHDAPLDPLERRALKWAGVAALAVAAVWAGLALAPRRAA